MARDAQQVTVFNPTRMDNVASFRKEASYYRSLVLVDTAKKDVVLDVRFYGKSATYCCAWLAYGYGPNGESARGGAKAGGYGYHKESAAMQAALQAMGMRFAEPFDGVGEQAMNEALEAVAAFLGVKDFMIIKAHG